MTMVLEPGRRPPRCDRESMAGWTAERAPRRLLYMALGFSRLDGAPQSMPSGPARRAVALS